MAAVGSEGFNILAPHEVGFLWIFGCLRSPQGFGRDLESKEEEGSREGYIRVVYRFLRGISFDENLGRKLERKLVTKILLAPCEHSTTGSNNQG